MLRNQGRQWPFVRRMLGLLEGNRRYMRYMDDPDCLTENQVLIFKSQHDKYIHVYNLSLINSTGIDFFDAV
jgi:hypothetical protein